MDNADSDQRNDNLDEEELVRNMKPLLEQGTQILNETEGGIKALDPDGRIARNAKNRTQGQQATPQEYYLAEKLSQVCLSRCPIFKNPCVFGCLVRPSRMILDRKVAPLGMRHRHGEGGVRFFWFLLFFVEMDTDVPVY